MDVTLAKKIIQLDNKIEIERLICILNLGICAALNSGSLTIEEAETYLYSPYTMEQLEKLGVDQELIELIQLGTELEDVKSLIPEKLSDSIEEIEMESIKFLKSLASNISTNIPQNKWIKA